MESLLAAKPLFLASLQSGDYVGFTFFIGSMAMMAASVFFFFEMNNVEGKWRTSLLVSGLITFIAAVHYYYMRDFWIENGTSPTELRYIDWILTVPLMCVEFYLILKAFGAKQGLLWRMIGYSVIMLVAGYSGVGKTALVHEVHKPMTEKRGYFAAGKFDQFQRNMPYSAILQAFRSLMRQLLAENEAQIASWREKLLGVLGPNGQVIIDVIPEVELIIGSQPAVPELGAAEQENRFHLVHRLLNL